MKTFTLGNVVSGRIYVDKQGWEDCEFSLTDSQIENFITSLCKGCREETKNRIRVRLRNASNLYSYSDFDKVVFTGERVQFFAGQSYPDELANLRKLLAK
jgi:hypothetical protein